MRGVAIDLQSVSDHTALDKARFGQQVPLAIEMKRFAALPAVGTSL
jgi:hypothetical protein